MTEHNVSIVIPSYNLGAYLRETVQSIEEARTPALREVIIVDDGSSDPETLHVLNELENTAYTIIRQMNRGVGSARNAGIRRATGEFILPVDSDNRIRRPYLDEAVTILEGDPTVGVVYGDAQYIGDKTGRWRVPEFNLLRLVDANYIDTCAVFRKKVWEDVGGYDENPPHLGWEDWDLWLRAAVKGWRFVHIDKIAFDYRVRPGSMFTHTGGLNVVMDKYLFSKPELAPLGLIRCELRQLLNVQESMEYRLGRTLMRPVRIALAKLNRRSNSMKMGPLTPSSIHK